MNDENFDDNQRMPPILTPRQRQVRETLQNVETKKWPLSEWYRGALRVLDDDHNPDRFSQAACSLRELMEKLSEVYGRKKRKWHDFEGKRRKIYERWRNDKKRYSCDWEGEKIDSELNKTLGLMEEYLEQNDKTPSRREQVRKGLQIDDPMFDRLPPDVQQRVQQERQKKGKEIEKVWGRLNKYVHHEIKEKSEESFFKELLKTLEEVILGLNTEANQREIEEILK